MRKTKKFLAIALAICLTAGNLPVSESKAASEVVATDSKVAEMNSETEELQVYKSNYFGSQLTETEEQVFYDALKAMYNAGEFKKGVVSWEVEVGDGAGMLPTDLLDRYMAGDASLLQMFQNASNAFMMDQNDLFYLDWTKLSVRIGKTSAGWSVHIGNGAYENLYLKGYDEAKIDQELSAMNAKIAEIKAGADSLTTREEKVEYVHDALIEQIEYVYRGTTDVPGDTPVGALVYGQAWCEGYARAFKAVMDEMGIPCLLIGGTGLPEAAQNGESLVSPDVEAHMWNYVNMNDGKWYAVDVTYDDPITQKEGDPIRKTCLLKGSNEFSARHVESGLFSQGGRNFQYPVISEGNIGESGNDKEGLNINVSYYDADGGAGWTSYTVMQPTYTIGDTKLIGNNIDGEGHYLYYKIKYIDSEGNDYTGWGDSWYRANQLFQETDDYTKSYCVSYANICTQVGYQFAIADREGQFTLPDDANILEVSDVIYFRDRYQDLREVKPSIIEREPSATGSMTAESTHVKYTYDMPLKLAEGYSEAALNVSTSLSGPNYRVENLTWKNTTRTGFDGRESDCCVVEFDFYPDTSYNYSGTVYTFELEGLVSIANESKPRSATIMWSSPSVNRLPCPYMPAPSQLLLSMHPSLLQTTYSPELFTDPLGNGLAGTNNYDLNLTLIASKPSNSEQEKMENALEDAGVVPTQNTSVFSLDLSLACLAMRTHVNSTLNEGKTKVCIAIPYPDGFDSREMEGVTFEAYHFRKDENGNYVPEKLICNATESGIWVIAESFSPFVVVAVDDENHDSEGKKMISAVTNSEMADVTVTTTPAAGKEETLIPQIMELKEGESCTYTFTPKAGYELEQVIWNGKEQEVTTNADGSYSVTYNWNELTEENNTLYVNFCASSVLEAEEASGFEVENPISFETGLPSNNVQELLPQATEEDSFSASEMELGKTVSAEMDNVTEVKLSAADLKLEAGVTSQLSITEGNAEQNEWTSSNEAVATVDQNGTVTAVAAGISYITVTNANGSAMCKVEVMEEEIIEVSKITLNHTEITMKIEDDPIELTATVEPNDATNKSLTWSNSDQKVAKLQDGKITALQPGTTTLTVTAPNGVSASCVVTVSPIPVESVSLNRETLTLEAGAAETLVAEVKPEEATDKTVSWSSDKTSVAIVDDNGMVTAVAPGTATITATAGDKTATCIVTVTGEVSDKLTVTVTNGKITNKSNSSEAEFDSREIARISTDVPEGQTFAYWKNTDTNAVVSYDKDYAFVVTESISLTAEFTTEATTEKEAFITLDSKGTIAATGSTSKLSYSGRSYIPEGWTVQERGIILTNKTVAESEITGMTASDDNPTVTLLAYVKLGANNNDQFVINVTNVKAGQTRTARAYMKCIDKDGVAHYVYSTNIVALTTK